MIRFTLNAKELKAMIDKATASTNKKAPISSLRRLYFRVENGNLRVLGTDMEQFALIYSKNVYDTEDGEIGIDLEDMKFITKMNGEITVSEIEPEKNCEHSVAIKAGKKSITLMGWDTEDIHAPELEKTEKVLTVPENWLYETVINLATFTTDNENNKMMQCINFNTKYNRAESLDGHRITTRDIPEEYIAEKRETTFMLHNISVPVLKKILNNKGTSDVEIENDKKYIRINGVDFTYIIRKIDGEYFRTGQMLDVEDKYRFIADRNNIQDIMTYDKDIVKDTRKPVVFTKYNGELYLYCQGMKIEASDEVKTSELNFADDFMIGFNPQFFIDAMKIIDTDTPVMYGTNNKAPMMVDGNEYHFLILPVNTQVDASEVQSKIRKQMAA